MKLIIAIVNNDDSAKAAYALTDAGFFMTKLSTTGGFLMVGNTTLLIGAEENEVTKAMDILRSTCITRKQINPTTASFGVGATKSIPGFFRIRAPSKIKTKQPMPIARKQMYQGIPPFPFI